VYQGLIYSKLKYMKLIILTLIGIILFSSCKKKQNPTSQSSTVVKDINGNNYDTVKIGKQVWLKQNLKVTSLNDGTSILKVTNDTQWSTLSTSGYCDYKNDESNSSVYGRLYNWYTVNTQKICPSGWHVPSKSEWQELSDYLGGDSVSGGKLKEIGSTHWLDASDLTKPNVGATNSSAFTALPAGFRETNGLFDGKSWGTLWWSTTEGIEGSISGVWHPILRTDIKTIENDIDDKRIGVSIRCLKD
jgi:uncharacterized protein (TIGR02145 family)